MSALSRRVLEEVGRAVVGKREALEMIMAAVLADGHVLLEDYPGLAKTLVARSFAAVLGLEFRRIQFTPDLLPGDITGGQVLDRESGRFDLRKGPLFAGLVLADEINRASPRTQSALLEAMQEGQVTLEGRSLPLPRPFIVLATQNPIEYEGTFPLPEAQLDRFIMRLRLGYPSAAEECEILGRRRERRREEAELNRVSSADEIMAARSLVEEIHVSEAVEGYIVNLCVASREQRQIAVGASPRGSLALMKLARAWAAMAGRDFVLPDDVKLFARPALCHRLILVPDLWMHPGAAEEQVESLLQSVPVPVGDEQA